MPTFVYEGTEGSVQYQIMSGAALAPTGLTGSVPCPDEYQPINLSVQENEADIFIEPSINATYFEMVDLKAGMWWPITDERNQLLYWGIVDGIEKNRKAGTVTYTFITLLTYLARHVPAGIMSKVSDLIPGVEKATPNQVLQFLVSHFAADIPNFHLIAPVPSIHLTTVEGPLVPWVMFLTVQQDKDQISVLEWLQKFFEVFPGYTWRVQGTGLMVTPPPSQQTEIIDLSESLVVDISDSTRTDIINSQRVTQRPWMEYGIIQVDSDGKIPDFDKNPQITDPVYLRQGDTSHWPPPENRKRIEPYDLIPWNYREDHFPSLPPAVLLWHAYVFKTISFENGEVKHKDVSDTAQWRTHVVALGPGRYFDAVTHVSPHAWVYRVIYLPKGLKIVPIHPPPEEVYEDTVDPWPPFAYLLPGAIVNNLLDMFGVFPEQTVRYGAEFHISVFGRAFERDTASYSAHYGVFRPPTLPPDAIAPPVELATDPVTDSSAAVFGRKPGPDLNLDMWTLVPPETEEVELSTMPVEEKQITLTQTLMDIAQAVVQENIMPTRTVALSVLRPFPIVAADIGKLASYGPDTGEISFYGLEESHTMAGSDLTLEVRLRVKEGATYTGITRVPPDEEEEGEAYVPPFMPPDGGLAPRPPAMPPPPEPIVISGTGSIEIENRFDLLSVEGPNGTRVRLYRTEAARSADAARPIGTKPEEAIMPLLIAEGTIEVDDWLDFHAIVGHVREGTAYYKVDGGSVTLHRFIPQGSMG